MSLFADDDLPRPPEAYRVLARKYRPAGFDTLIGQDAMVTTLANAISANRLAQAWLLTGVRGVGKTSTARIIAKALNCVGADGLRDSPTMEPCGVCHACAGISEGTYIDVIEMDAASRTKVEQMRELLDGVPYATVSSRYRIYIIDEVHMLSAHSFNALLKTLEEPPAHVRFIFATTEVQKLPATILSRCQRFDLKRVPADLLVAHFGRVLEAEGASGEADALALIARAAEGSVRDGLSILDQAIAMGQGRVTAADVRAMLGLADRGRVAGLLGAVLEGDAPGALERMRQAADAGADPAALFESLMEMVHGITRARIERADDPALGEEERLLVRQWADSVSFPQLHRLWQLLLKGHGDILAAPDPAQAADMAVLRIIHAGALPDPDQLARLLAGEAAGGAAPPAASAGAPAVAGPTDFAAVVALAEANRDAMLAKQLHDDVACQAFQPGQLTLAACRPLPPDFARVLKARLAAWTGRDWTVELVPREGAVGSLKEEADRVAERARAEAEADPRVAALIGAFPGAAIAGTMILSPRQQG